MELKQVRRIKLDVRSQPDHKHRFGIESFRLFPRLLPYVLRSKETDLLVSDHRRGKRAAGNYSHRIHAPTKKLFNGAAQHRPA